jgi:hypothetical protein
MIALSMMYRDFPRRPNPNPNPNPNPDALPFSGGCSSPTRTRSRRATAGRRASRRASSPHMPRGIHPTAVWTRSSTTLRAAEGAARNGWAPRLPTGAKAVRPVHGLRRSRRATIKGRFQAASRPPPILSLLRSLAPPRSPRGWVSRLIVVVSHDG